MINNQKNRLPLLKGENSSLRFPNQFFTRLVHRSLSNKTIGIKEKNQRRKQVLIRTIQPSGMGKNECTYRKLEAEILCEIRIDSSDLVSDPSSKPSNLVAVGNIIYKNEECQEEKRFFSNRSKFAFFVHF